MIPDIIHSLMPYVAPIIVAVGTAAAAIIRELRKKP